MEIYVIVCMGFLFVEILFIFGVVRDCESKLGGFSILFLVFYCYLFYY